VPTDLVAVSVALADKLDTLTGFWAIEEKPTGSKDPYALRRAALGVVRLVRENGLEIDVGRLASGHLNISDDQWSDLAGFIQDRLKVTLRDEGIGHDVVDASASAGQGDILRTVQAAEALAKLLKSDDGQNLLAGYRRAANILAAEEKKGTKVAESVSLDLIEHAEEQTLYLALVAASENAAQAVEAGDFEAAMHALATLRGPIDAFFDAVLVNADDEAVRANRLALLTAVRDAIHAVADLSKIEG
jgi:glycyl-tRNA synthetase beta chain